MNVNAPDLVTLNNGRTVTSSRLVAKFFKKQHKNILRLFHERIVGRHSANFTEINFELSEYVDASGRVLPELLMTKDGFIAIATKLRGAEEWQERFIAAFNGMSDQIERVAMSMWMRRLDVETRDATSVAKASIGSRFMNDRRKAKPVLEAERQKLQEVMEPMLFGGNEIAH